MDKNGVDQKNVRLNAFEKATFYDSSGLLTKAAFPEAKTLLLRREGIYQYAGTPVLQIIADLRRNDTVQIVVHGDLGNATFFGTKTPKNDTYSFLQKVCLTINARIDKTGKTITITGSNR